MTPKFIQENQPVWFTSASLRSAERPWWSSHVSNFVFPLIRWEWSYYLTQNFRSWYASISGMWAVILIFIVRARFSSPAPRDTVQGCWDFVITMGLPQPSTELFPRRRAILLPSASWCLMLMSVIINLSAERAGGRPQELVIESAKQVPRSSGDLSSHASPRKSSRRQGGLNGAPSVPL